MQQLRQYCKQIFDTSFHRKSNITLLHENLKKNPQGVFFSIFKTGQHKLTYEESFGSKREINYHSYHLFFGNSVENIACITASDLSYQYQSVIHKHSICSFSELPAKMQDKIIANLDNLDTYQADKTFELIEKYTKQKISTFIFPETESFYKKINKIFLSDKLNSTLNKKTKQKIQKI